MAGSRNNNWKGLGSAYIKRAFHIRKDNETILREQRVNIMTIESSEINANLVGNEEIKSLYLEMELREQRLAEKSDFQPILSLNVSGRPGPIHIRVEALHMPTPSNVITVTDTERKKFTDKWADHNYGTLHELFFDPLNPKDQLLGYDISSEHNQDVFQALITNGKMNSGRLDIFFGVKVKKRDYKFGFAPVFSFYPSTLAESVGEDGQAEGGHINFEYIHPCPNTCPDQ